MGITDRKRQRDGSDRRPKKAPRKFKKQKHYHSSSEDDTEDDAIETTKISKTTADQARSAHDSAQTVPASIDAQDSESDVSTGAAAVEAADNDEDGISDDDIEDATLADPQNDSEDSSVGSSSSEDSDANDGTRKKKKRNDASALSTSISKILGSKLSSARRADPVLARSTAAAEASKELNEAKLEMKTRKKINSEKRQALDKGRIEDVLGLQRTDISTAQILETEKRLKKTAQRGVVKLFNAVRAAQVQGESARREARKQGVVGMSHRDEKVSEMSKHGFLDLIAQGGKKAQPANT